MTDAVPTKSPLASPAKKPDTGFLPVLPPRFALVELAIFAAVIACEIWIDAFPDLTRLNPHPYWVAVLLLSLQYGTVSGLLAAALAIAGTWVLGLPEPEIGEAYFTYLVRVWLQPVLWIVVALLLGSFRMRQIEERDTLQRQVDDASVQSAMLFSYSNGLKARVDKLERQLAVSAKPETTELLDALALLGPAGTADQRATAAAKALRIAVPTAQASVLALDGDRFRVVLAHGSQSPSQMADLRLDEPLARAVMQGGRSLSVLNGADDVALAGAAKVAIPIPGSDGRVAGLLRVEDIAARDLEPRLLPRLEVLARGLSSLVSGGAALAPAVAQPQTVVPLIKRLRHVVAGRGFANAGMATARPPLEPKS